MIDSIHGPVVLTTATSAIHDTGPLHPERPARITAALVGVRRAGAEVRTAAAADERTLTQIARVHPPPYLEEMERSIASGARLFHSADNAVSAGTWRAATDAVAAALEGAEAIMERSVRRGFVIARPPGHHAERSMAMGFCFFNTIAIVAETLLSDPAIQRIAIVDFDVHHGNGTQHHFEDRPDVLFASIHRWPFYPGTGANSERGSGQGEGATVNVPMPEATGDAQWLREFERKIARSVDEFRPDFILVSAGFDAHERDPLGGMRLSSSAYASMTATLTELADRHSDGRLLSLLEGGYDLEGITDSVQQHVGEMLKS